ncbi:MAG: DUF4388 domain-containing protein [candidate division NC10 bacterium]
MAFVGRLELSVADILQTLSLSRKTGKLRLSRMGNTGEIVFKNGTVIYAASASPRNTLGQILVKQKHITERTLMAALEVQHLSPKSKRLGVILVEKGVITPAVLQEAIRHQLEEVISEFLIWEIGFFRFEPAEISADDGIMLDVQELLVKVGMAPEHLPLEGTRRLDEGREAEKDAQPAPEVAPPPTPEPPPGGWLEEALEAAKDAPSIPEVTPPSSAGTPAGGRLDGQPEGEQHGQTIPEVTPPPSPDLPPDWLEQARETEKHTPATPEVTPVSPPGPPAGGRRDGRGEAEKPKQPKPEATPPSSPDPPPAAQRDARGEVQRPTRSKPEATPPSSPDPPPAAQRDARGEAEKSAQPTPDQPPPDRPDERRKAWRPTRPRPEGTAPPAPDLPTVGRPDGKGEAQGPTRPKPEVAPLPADLPAEETSKPWIPAGREKQPVPADSPSSPATVEGKQNEIQFSDVVDEIMLNSPIAPWVPMMLSAADVVGRGILLFEREGRITGYDQFGVEGGIEGGDAQIRNIKIPLNEPSIFAGVSTRRKVYRGKIEPGKWNEYFVGLIGGSKPQEAVIIPIIMAGKVVGIFYGDDAGTGSPLGDVKQLEAMILKTFSAIELSLVEKKSKSPA